MYVHVLLDGSGRAVGPLPATHASIPAHVPEPSVLTMLLCSPDAVDRTTGAVRDVAAFVEVTPAALVAVLAVPTRPADDVTRSIAILVHRVSRRAVAVGPFASALEAQTWWASRGNRLAANAAMAFAIVALVGETVS